MGVKGVERRSVQQIMPFLIEVEKRTVHMHEWILIAACVDSLSYDWRSGSPCCESDMDRRPSSVDTFLSHHHRHDSSRWSSR